MSDLDLDELRAELAEFAPPAKKGGRSARDERIIAGFEEIQRFVEEHGRAPRHGEERDIFERLYAVRLNRLLASDEARTILEALDHQGLLIEGEPAVPPVESLDDEALRAELSGERRGNLGDDLRGELRAGFRGAASTGDITELRHVRPTAEKRVPDEIANREVSKDFESFKPLFERVQQELAAGTRTTQPFEEKAGIQRGQWFIVGGQVAYVADMGEVFINVHGREDARLRVIYGNGTESNLLMRSLQRALYKDAAGRRIIEPNLGPLFAGETDEADVASGTVYVLRSKSQAPQVLANRELLHKIGVTSGDLDRRLANARHDPTFLMADVEVVATYKLANVNRTKLEHLIHRIFGPARLDIQITDRFGQPVVPREWFLVPLFVVDEAIERIRDGSITDYVYDPGVAALVRVEG